MQTRHAEDPAVHRSLVHSIKDGVSYTVMSGGAESWFAAWALHFQASTAQIGLLASLPALVGSLGQLLGAALGRRLGRRRVILGGATFQGLTLLPLALIPLLWPAVAVPVILACVAGYHGGVNLAAPQWSSLMGDLVPEERRGAYFGLRNRLCSLTGFLALAAAGLLLDRCQRWGRPELGFLLVFAAGFLARALSVRYLALMIDPPGRTAALSLPPWRDWARRLRHSPFARFTLLTAGMSFAVSLSGPFFIVYLLKELGYSYLVFMLISAAAVLVQVLTLQGWGRIGDSAGNRAILSLTGWLMPLAPALWLVSAAPGYLLAIQVFVGMVWAGWSLSAGNFLYDLVPPVQRATWLALNAVASGLAGFVGAMTGSWLAALLPPLTPLLGGGPASALLSLFALSALARLALAILLLPHLKEVRPVEEISTGALIFRVTRIFPLAGLVFDVVGRRRGNGE